MHDKQKRGYVASTVESYMNQRGASEEEAVQVLMRTNYECVERYKQGFL